MPQGLDKKCFRVFYYLEMFGFQFVKKSLLFQVPKLPLFGSNPTLKQCNKESLIDRKLKPVGANTKLLVVVDFLKAKCCDLIKKKTTLTNLGSAIKGSKPFNDPLNLNPK